MTPGAPPNGTQRSPKKFLGRFLCNVPRKVSLFAGLAAIMALVIGAGFANMSASGAPTSLETAVVRWTAVGFLVIGAAAYAIGSRMLRNSGD